MTKEDIIRMAKEAGLVDTANAPWMMEFLERFAKLVAEAEREECAKVCEAEGLLWGRTYAKKIRARGTE